MRFRTIFVYFKSCRYNICIIKTHLPLLLRRWSYNLCVLASDLSNFNGCRYNLCIFARDLSIFKSCRYNLCIIKTHSLLLLRRCSYNLCIFARDLSILRVFDIIYAFSHQICLFLRVVNIIYALSRNITLITTEIQL